MSKPYIWAHRGADAYAPENTLEAFAMAAQMGADGVELDVQLTKDGQIVVCHDERIDRTSNGKGWLKDFTLEELKKLDFSGGNKRYSGVQIPTLEEVLDHLQNTGMLVNIELKTQTIPYPALVRKCIELVRAKGYTDRIIFSSFNHLSLQKVRFFAPEIPIGYLYLRATPAVIPIAGRHGANAMHLSWHNLQKPGILEACIENGQQINVWTVNKEEEMRFCMEHGVNAVITDCPDRIREIRERLQ